MKLYYCEASGIDYDPSGHVIANSEEEAQKKFTKYLDDDDISHGIVFAIEIKELEGYEIVVREKRSYAKGSNYFN